MVNYKLDYFPLRARGECARYIFHQAGVEFEDHIVPIADWPALKGQTPFRAVPVLYIDDKPLSESAVICAYLAREFGLDGADSYEAAKCLMLAAKLESFWAKFAPAIVGPIFAGNLELAATNYEEHMKTTIPDFLVMFEKLLDDNGGTWFVGSKVTWIDLNVANTTEGLTSTYDSKVLDKYPKLKAHSARVHKLPKIKKYVEKRKTPFMPVQKLQEHLKLPA